MVAAGVGWGVKLSKLVPLLHKYSFLWTKPCVLQCDVVVQVCEFPSGEVGDKLKAFIGITFGLDMSYQSHKFGFGRQCNLLSLAIWVTKHQPGLGTVVGFGTVGVRGFGGV